MTFGDGYLEALRYWNKETAGLDLIRVVVKNWVKPNATSSHWGLFGYDLLSDHKRFADEYPPAFVQKAPK